MAERDASWGLALSPAVPAVPAASWRDDADDVYQRAFEAVESMNFLNDDPAPASAASTRVADYRSLRRPKETPLSAWQYAGVSSLRRDGSLANGSHGHGVNGGGLNGGVLNGEPAPSLSLSSQERPAPAPRPAPRPKPPSSLQLNGACSYASAGTAALSDASPDSPSEAFPSQQNLHCSNGSLSSASLLDDLRQSELHLKRKKAFIERVLEQHENLSEQKRRNDIFQLCDRLQSAEVSALSGPKPHQKSSRIKTNGSLPRDKGGLESPVLSPRRLHSSSDDLHSSPSSRPDNTLHHGYENVIVNPGAGNAVDLASHLLNGSPISPSSPRRGIRTVLPAKETFSFPQDITNEVIEKHPELYKQSQSHSQSQHTPKTRLRSGMATSTPREQPVVQPEAQPEPVSEKVVALSLELEFVRKERLKIMSAMTVLKARLSEIETQQEDAERDASMEQAFIRAELQSKRDKARAQQARIASLRDRSDKCQREINLWQDNRNKQQRVFSMSVEAAEAALDQLRDDLQRCGDEATRQELRDRIYQQADVLDSEKKLYEDLEFKYLEEESVWLARKEELSKELAEAVSKHDEYDAQMRQLESWVDGEGDAVQAEGFTEQKLAYLQRLEEGQSQLDVLDARIDELQRQGATVLGSNPQDGELQARTSSLCDLDLTDASSDRMSSTPGLTSLESSFYSGHHQLSSSTQEPAGESRHDDSFQYFPTDMLPPPSEARGMASAAASPPPGAPGPAGSMGAHVSFRGGPPTTIPSKSGSVGPDGRVPDLHGEDELRELGGHRSRQRGSAPRQQRPLTRYLPIRTEDLDLRQHVESAGHAVDICPFVTIDRTSCRGVLHKASSRFKNWQKRWFVFDRSARTLSYFKSRRDTRARGGVHFQSIAEVYVDHLNGHKQTNPNCVFVVKTLQRSYHLMAPSPEAMRIWVDVIFTGAEAYQEFD